MFICHRCSSGSNLRFQTSDFIFFNWRPWLCLRKLWSCEIRPCRFISWAKVVKRRSEMRPCWVCHGLLFVQWGCRTNGEKIGMNWWMLFVWNMYIYIYVFCMVTSGNLLYITNLCRTMTISLRFRESCNVLRWYFWSSANSVLVQSRHICVTTKLIFVSHAIPKCGRGHMMCDVGHVRTLGACPRSPHRSSEWVLSYRLLYRTIKCKADLLIYLCICLFNLICLHVHTCYMDVQCVYLYNIHITSYTVYR